MNEPDDFEAILQERLRHKAETVTAPAASVGTIVRRSHRRRARHRAAGALAGAGALLLGGAVLTRSDLDDVVTVAADGDPGGGSTPPGSTPGSTPGTDVSVDSTMISATTAPSTTTVTAAPPFADGRPGLVPDPVGGGLLSNEMRIDVSPATRLGDGWVVTVRGTNFPVGAQLLFIECTTHGLGAATLRDGAGYCDLTSQMNGFAPQGTPPDANGSAPDVGPNGTFTARYKVRRNLSTMGGAYDCALGGLTEGAGAELRDLLDAGTLGPASFPEGVFGCSVVAVVEAYVPNGDGTSTVEYAAATAQILHFDPNAPAQDPVYGVDWGAAPPSY